MTRFDLIKGETWSYMKDAEDQGYTHPWPLVCMLVKGIICALVLIATAIDENAPPRDR